ncbi:hypothetical protein HY416_01955 [Candidatus Kaiserbacteria bacterium]|nr:hypothetical protein [Candidatus Kaiserbacteria bacterium]
MDTFRRNTLAFFLVFSLMTTPLSAFAVGAPTLTLAQKVQALAAAVGRLGGYRSSAWLSHEDRTDVIESAVAWLVAAQEEDGHFRYEYMPYEDRYLDDDNIVRQAGAFYELGEVLRRGQGDEEAITEAMFSSIGYFASLTQEGIYEGKSFRCVTDPTSPARCKLGATALALVGILSFVESEYYQTHYDDDLADPDGKDYGHLTSGYASFLTALQKENGGFRSTFVFGRDVQSDTESSYANGEAFLALARYEQYRSDEKIQRSLDTAFQHLKNDVPFDIPLYLWVMAALVDINAQEPRPEYEAYARAYTDWRMAGFTDMRETKHNMCAYLEGIVLGYDVFDGSLPPSARAPYRDEIEFWLAKERALQVAGRDRYRVMFDGRTASFAMIADPERAYGGFLTGEEEFTQRIDFTQHCLNSYLVWDDVQEDDSQ